MFSLLPSVHRSCRLTSTLIILSLLIGIVTFSGCQKTEADPGPTDLGTIVIDGGPCSDMQRDVPFFPMRNFEWVYEIKYDCQGPTGPLEKYHTLEINYIDRDTIVTTRTLHPEGNTYAESDSASPKRYHMLKRRRLTFDENGDTLTEDHWVSGWYHQDIPNQRIYEFRSGPFTDGCRLYDELLCDLSLEPGDQLLEIHSQDVYVNSVQTVPFGCLNLKKIQYGTNNQWYMQAWGTEGMGTHESNPNTSYCATKMQKEMMVYGSDTLVLAEF